VRSKAVTFFFVPEFDTGMSSEARLRLLRVIPSERKGKKLMAIFSDGRVVHFGAAGYEDYTIHRDPARKARYISRHARREDWKDPTTPGCLSRFLLWEHVTLAGSLRAYRRRFGV
jgi:Family of unknown function (DUF5754)